jgi:hypothetical protein
MKEEVQSSPKKEQVKVPLPDFIPLKDITSAEWIKVPLLTTLRKKSHSYYGNKYESKEYVPRMLWLKLDWTLA